ncbi:MAG: ABC transporter substrate-binding protein [Rhodothermales bacterium]|nr:ABC transporter substrate-binding protein [Rhodothermales bacterium]
MPAAEFAVSGLSGADLGIEVSTVSPGEAMHLLRAGELDVALVPTLNLILDPEGLEVLPAVALSAWHYPYARIHLPESLTSHPDRISFVPEFVQEALMARVILREHYAMNPEFVAVPPHALETADGARLIIGRNVPDQRLPGLSVDLGEEWFELANYPMVWGVFAMRAGEADADTVDRFRTMIERSETLRSRWADSKDHSESMRHFFEEDIRLRFDDLALACITELMDHAFFYELTDEIRDFPMARIESRDHDDSGQELHL